MILESIGIPRKKLRITNAVRCRPPDNRKPTAAEIRACRFYLKNEVDFVRPRVIVAMGRTALQALAFKAKERGKLYWSKRWNAYIVFTWHPAYCLRAGSKATHELRAHLSKALKGA